MQKYDLLEQQVSSLLAVPGLMVCKFLPQATSLRIIQIRCNDNTWYVRLKLKELLQIGKADVQDGPMVVFCGPHDLSCCNLKRSRQQGEITNDLDFEVMLPNYFRFLHTSSF